MTISEQRRLRRSAALHGLAVVVFTLLALSGIATAGPGLYGMAVPFIIAGIAGGGGAAILTVTVWRLQRGDSGAAPDDTAAPGRSAEIQRRVRLAMAAAAVLVVSAGVRLAPQGMDRGFVISVAAGLAVALALFALLAGDRPRPADQPGGAPGPH